MKFFQITAARLRTQETSWRATINRFRGPAPLGLALAHMVAESNGNEDPTVRNLHKRPVGLMQIPLRLGRRHGYTQDDLQTPVNNIYVWALLANKDAAYLHTTYATWWSSATYDFWLAVRLMFIMGSKPLTGLFDAAHTAGASYRSMNGVQTWVRTKMNDTKKFGSYSRRTLLRLMDHIDDVRTALVTIDGPDKASYAFTDAPAVTPGIPMTVFGQRAAL